MCVKAHNKCIIPIVVPYYTVCDSFILLLISFLLPINAQIMYQFRCVWQFQFTAGTQLCYSPEYSFYFCSRFQFVAAVSVDAATFLSYRLSGLLMSNRTMLKGKNLSTRWLFGNVYWSYCSHTHSMFSFSIILSFFVNDCNVDYMCYLQTACIYTFIYVFVLAHMCMCVSVCWTFNLISPLNTPCISPGSLTKTTTIINKQQQQQQPQTSIAFTKI